MQRQTHGKDKIKEWTGQSLPSLLRIAHDRRRWAAITAEASVGVLERRLGVIKLLLARRIQSADLFILAHNADAVFLFLLFVSTRSKDDVLCEDRQVAGRTTL